MVRSKPYSILVIRRDNIGDLVCTTPLLSALRRHFPDAHINALVNGYNAPVLDGNPELDEVCVYHKAKHREAGESKLRVWLGTLRLMLKLRRQKFDLAIVATPGHQPGALRFAHWVRARRVIAYDEATKAGTTPATPDGTRHETEEVMRLLLPLGIDDFPGPVRVFPNVRRAERVLLPPGAGPLIALHISARKPAQRWPIERFAELAHSLHASHGARFLLFWSPGAENHAQHPGDDVKAERLIALCHDLPLLACPTHRLEDLIAGLSRCDRVICSDGGAMHLAAGLGKPIVCFFGNSSAQRWRPWGVAHELLQPESRDVGDISLDAVRQAYARLEQRLAAQPRQALATMPDLNG
ncbi:glycosyltransferase family 9 protein [Propionivibrio sp.]|uniref:glycosyltransferase family 9 protein n=1 Tax=Propionivibrio sp. TaxID=2212460 RepID=UPI002617AFA0|nr:glycosyltransferase family 9 protein [Propionivibrio sp.]